MKIERLDWDSNFFDMQIGRVNVSSEEEVNLLAGQQTMLKNSYDLVYVFAKQGLDFSVANAKLVDEKVVYTLSNNTIHFEANHNIILWESDKGVTDDLLHLALVSGKYSRFRLDEKFPKGSYERLYSCWIEQSVNGKIASGVLCYMIDDVPKGLVTVSNNNDKCTIGLVAIHEDLQNKGIGTVMMQHVLNYADNMHCGHISVATQLENVAACRLYEKAGFKVESVMDVWHWWL